MIRGTILFFALSLAFAVPAAAEPQRYRLDPVHTRLVFFAGHLGLSHGIGTLSGITGELTFDDEDWSRSRVTAQIPLKTLDMGNADWRAAVLDGALLDAEKHPVARFESTAVIAGDGDEGELQGELTLRGRTRPVTLALRFNGARRNPYTFDHTVGFTATATLDREDFGMVAFPNVIGDAVEIRLEVEAARVD